MTDQKHKFATEADLVRAFLEHIGKQWRHNPWTVYPETADWDLLLVHETGFQVGLEAKLSLNAKVIDQALSGHHSKYKTTGPDYRGVIVPYGGAQLHLERICAAIGIGIISVRIPERGTIYHMNLPGEESYSTNWPNWLPASRCPLPDYIPDVEGGKSSPVKLTEWKIKAIRLMIVLDRRGFVTRDDMSKIQISPSRWTDCYNGFLARGPGGYIRCSATPDLRAQHPINYAQIEAETDQWVSVMKIASLDPAKSLLI